MDRNRDERPVAFYSRSLTETERRYLQEYSQEEVLAGVARGQLTRADTLTDRSARGATEHSTATRAECQAEL